MHLEKSTAMKRKIQITVEVDDSISDNNPLIQSFEDIMHDMLIKNGMLWNIRRAMDTITKLETQQLDEQTRQTFLSIVAICEARDVLYRTMSLEVME